ncbi:uncharacterized protein [Argopecten irradians]|uniref:uncharacterized protein n=1 Tax=Argopecten irradians TaxID=31199 RepID=UPI00371E7146
MVHTQEYESLLPTKNTKHSHRRRSFIIIILVTIAILLGTTLGLAYGFIYWKSRCIKTHKHVQLKHVLPGSFGIEFKLHTKNTSDTSTENDITIKWEHEPKDIRYRQKTEEMVSNDSVLTTVTIVNNNATVSYELGNETCWLNPDNSSIFEWYSILPLIMESVRSNHREDGCRERMWTTTYNGRRVFICIIDQRISYIRYDNRVAQSQEWMVPSQSSIKLPSDATKCGMMDSEMTSLLVVDDDKRQNTSDSTRQQLSYSQTYRKDNEYLKQPEIFVRSAKPDCLFIHGIGVKSPKTGYKSLKSMSYWGHIEKNTPQCSSHKFIQFNTVDNGWDSVSLHKMFCEFATGSNVDGRISNKIIFTHSMGNNIVAAALHRKVCSFDVQSSKWFSVSAPWRGSKVVLKLEDLCSGHLGPSHHKSENLLWLVLEHTKYCTHEGKMSPAYRTLHPTYKSPTGISYDDLVAVARLHVTGALCGTSPWGMGLSLSFSGTLKFIQSFSHLDQPNDGVVALNSCNVFGKKFQSIAKFALMSVNHLESSMKFGCRKPLCSWYQIL